ncbi:MAG: dTMP kinase [Syntrophobacteraceae bacterium]
MEQKTAKFLSFEGIDGCGKSTLLTCVSNWLDTAGIQHIKTREPGGTLIGDAIRGILLDPSFADMDALTEILLYSASRTQHVKEVIRPALDQNLWVLTDRYVDATLAYQGYGRGLDLKQLRSLHEWSTESLWPDLTFLFDCSIETALERREQRNGIPDRLELQHGKFHENVRKGYLSLAAAEPDRFLLLDSGRPLEEVTECLHSLFQDWLCRTKGDQ